MPPTFFQFDIEIFPQKYKFPFKSFKSVLKVRIHSPSLCQHTPIVLVLLLFRGQKAQQQDASRVNIINVQLDIAFQTAAQYD